TWKSFYFAVRAFAFDEELVEPAAPEPGPAGSSAEVCNAEPAEPASSEPGLAVSGSPGAQQVSEYGHAGLGRPSAEVCDAELAEPASSEPGLPSQAAQARSKCPSTGVPAEAASSEPGPTDLGDRDGAQQVPEHAQLLLEDVVLYLKSVAPEAMSVSSDGVLDELTAVQELSRHPFWGGLSSIWDTRDGSAAPGQVVFRAGGLADLCSREFQAGATCDEGPLATEDEGYEEFMLAVAAMSFAVVSWLATTRAWTAEVWFVCTTGKHHSMFVAQCCFAVLRTVLADAQQRGRAPQIDFVWAAAEAQKRTQQRKLGVSCMLICSGAQQCRLNDMMNFIQLLRTPATESFTQVRLVPREQRESDVSRSRSDGLAAQPASAAAAQAPAKAFASRERAGLAPQPAPL
ncbi:unnamed protein product, partial [Effrenium voratum]